MDVAPIAPSARVTVRAAFAGDWDWLRTMEPKDLANFLAAVGAQPECVAPDGSVGNSAGFITHLSDTGQGIVIVIANAIPTTILDGRPDPRL